MKLVKETSPYIRRKSSVARMMGICFRINQIKG